MINLPRELDLITPLLQPDQSYYLVGGSVRDALALRESRDLDIVCTCDTRILAKKLANAASGAFFMLDEKRNISRVIFSNPEGNSIIVDISRMRGDSIQDDLLERDFTINAMAVDLSDPTEILDPLMGKRDLTEKWLRSCKESSFKDDPIRMVRAARYAVQYGLQIDPQTIARIQGAAILLSAVSKERKRDEIFKILDHTEPQRAFELLRNFGVLDSIGLGGIADPGRTFERLHVLTALHSWLLRQDEKAEKTVSLSSDFEFALQDYRDGLGEYLARYNSSDRSLKSLDGLATLLWAIEGETSEEWIAGFGLSNEEACHVQRIIRYKGWMTNLLRTGEQIDARKAYHFYRNLGQTGLSLALLNLADVATAPDAEQNPSTWRHALEICRQLVEIWFSKPEIANPQPLLNGRDVMEEFNLPQGELIGSLLAGLLEEQAAGIIRDKKQALGWIENQLKQP